MATDLGLVGIEKIMDWDVERRRYRCDCGSEFTMLLLPWANRNAVPKCDSCQAKARAAVEQDLSRERTEAAVAAEIPARYRWATFDAPELAVRVAPAMAIADARMAQDTRSVVLLGPAGSGKTSLACAVLRARAGRVGKATGTYVTAFSLTKARQEHRLGDGEAPRVAIAMSAPLLLLDELGAELGRNTAVQEVIHARYEAELPTIFTSGFTLEELHDKYGPGVSRRIVENATVIMTGRALKLAGGA